VIGLNGEMNDPESLARRTRECTAKLDENDLPAQARKALYSVQGHVDRVAGPVIGTRHVRHARSRPDRFAPGAGPQSAPGSERQIALRAALGCGATRQAVLTLESDHLDSATIEKSGGASQQSIAIFSSDQKRTGGSRGTVVKAAKCSAGGSPRSAMRVAVRARREALSADAANKNAVRLETTLSRPKSTSPSSCDHAF